MRGIHSDSESSECFLPLWSKISIRYYIIYSRTKSSCWLKCTSLTFIIQQTYETFTILTEGHCGIFFKVNVLAFSKMIISIIQTVGHDDLWIEKALSSEWNSMQVHQVEPWIILFSNTHVFYTLPYNKCSSIPKELCTHWHRHVTWKYDPIWCCCIFQHKIGRFGAN